MNGVLFSDENKSLLFNISDYQFACSKEADYYDINWLTVSIKYSDDTMSESFEDSCILTYELDELIKEIDDIIEGKESGMISGFMEPYLKFSVTRVDDIYSVQIRFVYDTTESWSEVYITQGMNKDEFLKMRDGLDSLRKIFPVRQVGQTQFK